MPGNAVWIRACFPTNVNPLLTLVVSSIINTVLCATEALQGCLDDPSCKAGGFFPFLVSFCPVVCHGARTGLRMCVLLPRLARPQQISHLPVCSQWHFKMCTSWLWLLCHTLSDMFRNARLWQKVLKARVPPPQENKRQPPEKCKASAYCQA
jgi:hypothetical protein